ncbi:MAG: motility associated factor glycosyltransferase family protein [Deltaproteobacteria bacterium]|nr:motility associated factor glycosyltransferase family protein [Deltaproteobacteria bacterium]
MNREEKAHWIMNLKNIFTNNLTALDNQFPVLAQRLKNHLVDTSWQAFLTESGVFSFHHDELDGCSASMCSRFDPITEGKTWFNINAAERYHPYVVLGCGLGYHILPFANGRQGNRKIAVIEASMDLFYLAMSVNDLTNIFSLERLSLFVSEQSILESALKDFCTSDTRYGLFLPSTSFNSVYYENISALLDRTIYECRNNGEGDGRCGAVKEFLNLLGE